jgi:hypothetical protein
MAKISEPKNREQSTEGKVKVKRKYAPPRVTLLKPYKETASGWGDKREDHPVKGPSF